MMALIYFQPLFKKEVFVVFLFCFRAGEKIKDFKLEKLLII